MCKQSISLTDQGVGYKETKLTRFNLSPCAQACPTVIEAQACSFGDSDKLDALVDLSS